MGDGDHKPPGNCNRHEHVGDSHLQSTSSTLKTKLHGQVRSLGAFLAHTHWLTQLLPCATCVESSHIGVRFLQVRPIHVGFFVFRAIHVGMPQLYFRIEPWNFVIIGCGCSLFPFARTRTMACGQWSPTQSHPPVLLQIPNSPLCNLFRRHVLED